MEKTIIKFDDIEISPQKKFTNIKDLFRSKI